MSEYQYYEFQAIDRPLTRLEQARLARYSARAEITATRFVNHYDWGDFRGNVGAWMTVADGCPRSFHFARTSERAIIGRCISAGLVASPQVRSMMMSWNLRFLRVLQRCLRHS